MADSTEYDFRDAPRLVRVRIAGVLKGHQPPDVVRALVRHPEFVTGMNVLIDLRAVDSIEMFVDDVRATAELVTRLGEAFTGSRWALVAPSDPLFGSARQFELMAADPRFTVRAFRSFDEAERFLGEEP